MSWYPNRNRGHTYGKTEPEYGGVQPAISSYSASKESYASTTEQVVEYRSYPHGTVTADNNYSPRKIDYQHGSYPTVTADNNKHIPTSGHNPLHGPRSSPFDSPKKRDTFSPRFGHGTGSPGRKVYDHTSSGDYYGKHNNNLRSNDKHDEVDDRRDNHQGNGYGRPYTLPVTTHTRTDPYDTSYDHNNEMRRGRSYSPPPPPPPPSYTVPVKDPYHETYYDHNNDVHKGNTYSPPTYTVKDPYYETPNKNRTIMDNPPPSIKTRVDKGVEYSPKNSPVSGMAQNSPFASSPRKDRGYSEQIDSAEARRRYGKAQPPADEQKHTGVIDSREAAKRYNGLLVSD